MGKIRGRLLVSAAFLILTSISLSISFEVVSDQRWYWTEARVISAVGILSAGPGSFLIGYSLSVKKKRRLWLAVPGIIVGLGWVICGSLAFASAWAGMNYFSSSDSAFTWDSYYGDYLIGWISIRALQAATVTGLVGGFLTGYGLAGSSKSITGRRRRT